MTNAAEKIECSVTDNDKTHQSDNILYPLTILHMGEAVPNVGKTRLSISEAANHAWVNRTYFYQKYITPGLIVPLTDERGKKYIELAELIFAVGSLPSKMPSQQTDRQHDQTAHTASSDNAGDIVAAQVLQVRIEGLQDALRARDEIVRIKDEQLQESKVREAFYQKELQTIRLLAAPLQEAADQAKQVELKKRKRWLGIF